MRLLGYFCLGCCLVTIAFHPGSGDRIFSGAPETVISTGRAWREIGRPHTICFPISETISPKVRSRKPALWRKEAARSRSRQSESKLMETLSQLSSKAAGKPTLFLLHHALLFYDPVVS